MGLRMQPRNEKFLTLFSKAGSNVVESAAILVESVAAPHERWAELAKRMHDTEHGCRRGFPSGCAGGGTSAAGRRFARPPSGAR